MAAASTVALSGIARLPPTTARQIGSGQVLIDASSVVKELIDNALDARAKSIFVDIAANTIDTIQVKDDGHGIPSEDRPLLCRRHCTSKIRDLSDLRDVGGKWLGFRGEALSSMVDMSSALMVTTRVEGEPVAVKLKYGRDGELASVDRDSHPVGTTVKLTSFFEYIPVRKQAAIKNAAKCLAKIRRLIQAYVFARPGIRFRFRVLKARNNAGDFVYAPKANDGIEDAVLKMFGKDCTTQCGLMAVEEDGFEIQAFLPKPTAVGPKISNYGSFVSIDARPVSSHRGTTKQLIHACKDRLGQMNASLAGVRDPFFCLNITCPPGSYDANIEPAKDDVLFENSDAVLGALSKLLKSYYHEAVTNINNDELSPSALQEREIEPEGVFTWDKNHASSQGYNTNDRNGIIESKPQPRWRPSMYGIDEDDLEFLQDDRAPVIDEEEEGRRAVEVSNPWTIARMNTAIKPRGVTTNVQLPSPAKSTRDVNEHSNPSKVATTPSKIMSAGPLTPQTSLKTNITRFPLNHELEHGVQRLSRPVSVTGSVDGWSEERRRDLLSDDRSSGLLGVELSDPVSHSRTQESDISTSSSVIHGNIGLGISSPADRVIHHQQLTQDPKLSQPATHQKRTPNPKPVYSKTDTSLRSRRDLPVAAGENRLYSNSNKDIRDWLGRRTVVRESDLAQERSFTPINRPTQSVQSRSLGILPPVDQHHVLQDERDVLRSDQAGPRTKQDHLRAYSEQAATTTTSSSHSESQLSKQFNQRQAAIARQLPFYTSDIATTRESNRPSLPSLQNTTTPVPRPTPCPNLRSQSTDNITAFFQSYLENYLENIPAYPHPCSKKSHHLHSSGNLPAEPLDTLHNPIFTLFATTTVETIVCHTLARHDHLPEWDCNAEDAYHSFAEHVSEERIMVWVHRLDGLLYALYERVDGMRETRGVLGEGVRRGLGKILEAGCGGGDGDGGGDSVVVGAEDAYEDGDEMEEEMLMDL